MKQRFKLFVLPLAVLLTVSCGPFVNQYANSSKLTSVLNMMAAQGYVDIDTNNNPSQHQYYESKINTDYGLQLDVTGFYQGYVPPQTRWAMIVVFANASDGTSFHTALSTDASASGYKSVWDTIVIHTASLDTYTAFDALKHSALTSSQAPSSNLVTSTTTSAAISSTNGSYRTEAQMLTILYDAGYSNIDGDNDAGTWAYREDHYYTTYGLSLTVIGFYQGYIMVGSEQTRWMKMEVFWDMTMATAVVDAINGDVTVEGFVHQEGKIVVHTASPQTWALFN